MHCDAPVANLAQSLWMVPSEKGAHAAMTRLVDVIQELGLRGEVSPFGRWVRLQGEQARRAAHGTAVPAESAAELGGAGAAVRLLDEDGLIAIAELAGDGERLKPVVGFRG